MPITDEKGRIFGKINLIDFLVIVFICCAMSGFYFGWRIAKAWTIEKSAEGKALVATAEHFYIIKRTCPNDGTAVLIKIPRGMAICDMWYAQEICPICKCWFTWLDTGEGYTQLEPEPKPKPKPEPKKKIKWPIRFNIGIF